MTSHNANNERIKRQYFTFLRQAKGLGESSVDAAAMAVAQFEESTRYRDFKSFRIEQAIAFKKRLEEQTGQQSGERLTHAMAKAQLKSKETIEVWEKEPSTSAFTDLMNRTLDRPKERQTLAVALRW